MFRTRDFMLVVVAISFLLLAIGTTVFIQSSDKVEPSPIVFAPNNNVQYTAEVVQSEVISRADRITAMKQKIAAGAGMTLSTPELEVVTDLILSEDEVTEESLTLFVEPLLCSNYNAFVQVWSPESVQYEVIEGARILFKETAIEVLVGSSTVSEINKEVILQLPIYAVPTGLQNNCLMTDVVGIAKDGSLIRNNEARLYGVFGAETVVGYALDGFPIYGIADLVTDSCGGVVVAGQYRYQLSTERSNVINCFAAQPVQF